MLLVARKQVRGLGLEGCLEDRLIFVRKLNPWRQRRNRCNYADLFQKFRQPDALILFGEVERGLLGSAIRGYQFHFV